MQNYLIASLFFISLLSPLIAQTCVSNLTDAQRVAITNAHNNYRNTVAGGTQIAANGVILPQASNMNTITYDMNIEALAQYWANTNPSGHNPLRNVSTLPGYVGENMYWSWASSSRPLTAGNFNVSSAVKSWFDEVFYFNGNVLNFASTATTTTGKAIGHFTQVIWAKTTRVGCGILDCASNVSSTSFLGITTTSYQRNVAFVCNYWNGGNYLGAATYMTGTPCSGCINGCSTTYPNLCA